MRQNTYSIIKKSLTFLIFEKQQNRGIFSNEAYLSPVSIVVVAESAVCSKSVIIFALMVARELEGEIHGHIKIFLVWLFQRQYVC